MSNADARITGFITLTVAHTGQPLGVNVVTIIDFEATQYPVNESRLRDGVPNLTYHDNDRGQTYPMGNGSQVTIKGRSSDRNPVLVEQSPEDITALLQARTA
tara:strand:+ start:460 stop:765 length:306 start_codon:yes stop_codon:yes gene_type:complete